MMPDGKRLTHAPPNGVILFFGCGPEIQGSFFHRFVGYNRSIKFQNKLPATPAKFEQGAFFKKHAQLSGFIMIAITIRSCAEILI